MNNPKYESYILYDISESILFMIFLTSNLDCGKPIRRCQPWEDAENADCFVWKSAFTDGKYSGRLTYPFLSQSQNYLAQKSPWIRLDIEKDLGSWATTDNACVLGELQNLDCWFQIYRMNNFVQFRKGYVDAVSVLDVVDITMTFDPAANNFIEERDGEEYLPIDWFYLCEATDNTDPMFLEFDASQPEPTAPPKPPSGQWDKCEEIEWCNTSTMDRMFQPAGWTSTDMLYNRVACFYQQTNYQSPDGFIGIRQSEFEKVERFNTNSAVWIVVDDNFQVDAIADQCENNQEEGCWRAIGKGERLFKVMRGWNDGNTTLDTARIPVNTASAKRMIICDADLHSFDVDEPEPEKLNPTLPNRFCNNAMMWHNPAGEPRQRWTLTKEKFPGLPNYVDTEKIYADGNGNYLWWTWVAWRGRWYISK